MENETDPASIKGLWQWATTRPQAYFVYFIALVLVLGLSFLAGTMKPKKPPVGTAPPAVSAPRS
jgi:hypothetical protein